MISALSDALTIFFIVAGLALLWLNLRVWRRRPDASPVATRVEPQPASRTVPKALPEQAEHIAGMSEADIARVRAAECLHEAERSTSETDKEIWLQMAEKWIKLVEDAERGRSVK
jgi:hypothetical protein